MTEKELRQRVADIMLGWEGAKKGSPTHIEILNIYNSYAPLARGYAVKLNDAWCAATASAAWITAGVAEWTGTECSCTKLIEIAKGKGIWVENDKYVPKLGDAVLYDWDDGSNYAATDNKGGPEHIGIVTQSGMDAFVVTEGNKGGAVGKRGLAINARYIRGFICPDYARYAEIMTERETAKKGRYDTVLELPLWARADIADLVVEGYLRGDNGKLDLSMDMVRTLIICKRMIDGKE